MIKKQFVLFTFAACALAAPGGTSAATLSVPVRASVQGFAGNQTIGTIVANDRFGGSGGDPAGLTATFTFANAFGFLDNSYEFDWVQIVNSEGGSRNFWPRPFPTIDPRPAANPDHYPFYYSKAEWTANTFAGQTIHQEGVFSRFGDVPQQTNGVTASFSTFLVVRDENRYTLGGTNGFCVLGGFEWTYAGAGNDYSETNNQGTSTVGAAILGPVDPRIIDRINLAIDSGATADGSATYAAWRNAANGNCTLVPEPGPAPIALLGAVLLLGLRRVPVRAPERSGPGQLTSAWKSG